MHLPSPLGDQLAEGHRGGEGWPQVPCFLGQVPAPCSARLLPFILCLVLLLQGAAWVRGKHNNTCSYIHPSFCLHCPGQSLKREECVSFGVCDKYEREVRKQDKGGALPLQKGRFKARSLKSPSEEICAHG